MAIFKRRSKVKEIDEIVKLRKIIDELNTTPVDYEFSEAFKKYIVSFEEEKKKTIDSFPRTDMDLMYNALDYEISAYINKEKEFAKDQRTNHLKVISHIKGILEGKLVLIKRELECLKQDLAEIEAEEQMYKELRS